MYLFEWHIVDDGFSVAEEFEGAQSECTSIGRHRRFIQDLANGGQVAAVLMGMAGGVLVVVRMLMLVIVWMRMVIFLRRIGVMAFDQYARLARADAAAIDGFKDQSYAEVERRGRLLKQRRRDASVDQSAEQHVTAETGEAF